MHFHSYSLFFGRPTKCATMNKNCTNTCWFLVGRQGGQHRTLNARTHAISQLFKVFWSNDQERNNEQEIHEHRLFHNHLLFFGRRTRTATIINSRTPANSQVFVVFVGRAASSATKNNNAQTHAISQPFVVFWSADRGRNNEQDMHEHLLFHSFSLAFGRRTRRATKNPRCTNTRYFTTVRCFVVGRQEGQQRTINARTSDISQLFVVFRPPANTQPKTPPVSEEI